MSYFAEIWFRGSDAVPFRENYSIKDETYHAHITLTRPFQPKSGEEDIKETIVKFCKGKTPIVFKLAGKGDFGEVKYIPVVSDELLLFANNLEKILAAKVKFAPKLGKKKILHLTVKPSGEIRPFPKTNFNMLRLTVIRDKKIWFSFDFATQEVLSREESLKVLK